MSDAILRERVANLLTEFGGDEPADDDRTACLRHLGVAALNLATEVDPEALIEAGKALPWTGVYLAWHQRDLSTERLSGLIDRHGLVEHLSPGIVERRLDRVRPPGDDQPVSPADRDLGDPRIRVLRGLAEDDRRVERLADQPEADRRDALLADPNLLALALQLREKRPATEAAADLAETLPDWPLDPPADALEVLARFEQSDFENIPLEWAELGDRPRRFEQSLANHLADNDLLTAVRAALAFAPPADQPLPPERALRSFLTDFSVFAAEPALLELTMALVQIRHRPAAHLRGAAPLEATACWVEYLRNHCNEFADARDITHREATNFAHYALHLVDMCDIGAATDVRVDEPVRRALMDIEDELKEFALAGRRDDLAERPVDLHRYDRSRWRKEGRRAQLADRLSRLCGAWRAGHRPGPPGSGPRPDSPLLDQCRQLVSADDQSPRLDAADNLLYRARLRGSSALESHSPDQLLDLLVFALQSARQAPEIDVDAPFVLDLRPLTEWLSCGETEHRRRLFAMLLEVRPPAADETTDVGLTARSADQRLQLDFTPSRQLEALLTLLATTDDADDSFAESLRDRLAEVVARSADEPTDRPDDGTDTDRVRRPVPSSSPEPETPGRRRPETNR